MTSYSTEICKPRVSTKQSCSASVNILFLKVSSICTKKKTQCFQTRCKHLASSAQDPNNCPNQERVCAHRCANNFGFATSFGDFYIEWLEKHPPSQTRPAISRNYYWCLNLGSFHRKRAVFALKTPCKNWTLKTPYKNFDTQTKNLDIDHPGHWRMKRYTNAGTSSHSRRSNCEFLLEKLTNIIVIVIFYKV